MSTASPSTAHAAPSGASSSPQTVVEDPASYICALLIVKKVASLASLSRSLGLPPFVIESSVAQRASSAVLRLQLWSWLRENPRVGNTLEPALLKRLEDMCTQDHLRSGALAATNGADDGLGMVLDASTARHFTQLSESVGQSFISVLVSPGKTSQNADWGSWFGGKLYDAFDYTGGKVSTIEENLQKLQQTKQQNPESSVSLLAATPQNFDFTEYVKEISVPFAENQKESAGRDDVTAGGAPGGKKQQTEKELPWPDSVPAQYFSDSFDYLTELDIIPLGAPTPAAAEISITGETFKREHKVLESRGKELRAYESSVEHCLFKHVESRANDFFVTSAAFTSLSDEGRQALEDLAQCRAGNRARRVAVEGYMRLGQLYRRRSNMEALHYTVECAGEVLTRLAEVDNWASLPERDIEELPKYVRVLTELEAFFDSGAELPEPASPRRGGSAAAFDSSGAGDGEEAASSATAVQPDVASSRNPTWAQVAPLRFMADVPARAKAARANMELLVAQEFTAALTGLLAASPVAAVPSEETVAAHSSAAGGGTSIGSSNDKKANAALWQSALRACEASVSLARLGSMLRTFHTSCKTRMWAAVRECVVGFLMSNDVLDDAKANALFSLGSSGGGDGADGDAEPNDTEKKRFFEFCVACKYKQFVSLLETLLRTLTQMLVQYADLWLQMARRCFSPALASFDRHEELIAGKTRDFLAAVVPAAETYIALLLGTKLKNNPLSNRVELEEVTRTALGFIHTVVARLTSLTDSHKTAGDTPENAEEAVLDAARSLVGGTVRPLVVRLVKVFFRTEHSRNTEKLRMMLDAEEWQPKPEVDGLFQTHLEALIACDATSMQTFDAMDMEKIATAATAVAPTRNTADALSASDRMANATKLYLCVDEGADDPGRVACNALLILIEILHDYNEYLARFRFLAFEVVTGMHELIAVFDAHASSLILNAQAVKKGALTTITAQNLAVASQSAVFLSELIPLLQQKLTVALRIDSPPSPTVPATGEGSASAAVDKDSNSKGSNNVASKLGPFVQGDLTKLAQQCGASSHKYFHKLASLVENKAAAVGGPADGAEWKHSGNAWIMTMLREVVRLTRNIRPLLPPADERCVVVPLLGRLARRIKKVTAGIAADSEAYTTASSDVMLFKANVEKFGYDVLLCERHAACKSPSELEENLSPMSSDEAVLKWFFPK